MIYISVIHETWTPPVGDLHFQKWLASKYVEEVKRAIDEEIYAGKWRNLSPRYKQWKLQNHLSPKCWEATGELKNRLTTKFGLVVTFSGIKYHSGTKLTCTQIARNLEYGNLRIPGRLLFTRVYNEMKTTINRWYELYLEELNEL